MRGKRQTRVWLVVAAVALAGAGLSADTLYMRNGDQLRGQLVAVRNGTIEFRESSGSGSRTVRVDVADVRRIDFDDQYEGSSTGNWSGNNPDNSYGRPSGMRERSITVSADVPFIDTGVSVRSGQTVYFVATGQVTWGPNRKDGPDGERNSPENPNRPMPNRAAGSLIGRIGTDSGDYFFIGNEKGALRMRGSGRLFLGINDDYLDDNRGNFRVTVYY